ncbi:MAG: ABC transporter ATP-binding protein [Phycisphaerae bacterium]|nr:ABC transporter ATP-binding protein [Phycisphaerae bacterium]
MSQSEAVRTTPPQRLPEGEGAAPIIRLEGIHKRFGKQVVLSGVDLDIRPRQTTVVLGPSGSGKSVMLKHIVGLLRPDAGRVFFDGQRVDHLRDRELRIVRLQIGFLFQLGALFDSDTVADNVAFPLVEHTRLSPEERRQRAIEALRRVDMEGAEDKLPSQLSGGQRKRVALARAIVLQPRVVLYDEPTTGLDPIRADGIDQLVVRLKRELGVTGIVVTHDLNSARKVADRVVMLLHGRIAADGVFADLEQCPDPQVQQFLLGKYRADDEPPADGDTTLFP